MSRFSASDAERQAADAVCNYLNRALRMLAERLELETALERDPATFAAKFPSVVTALVEAQAREYQSWVFFDRLQSLDKSVLSGLADIAEQLADRNAGLCDRCKHPQAVQP